VRRLLQELRWITFSDHMVTRYLTTLPKPLPGLLPDLRMTALARTSSNCKRQTHFSSERSMNVSVRLEKQNYWTWVWSCLSRRQTDRRYIASRKVILTLTLHLILTLTLTLTLTPDSDPDSGSESESDSGSDFDSDSDSGSDSDNFAKETNISSSPQ
jgi:hypothetical protein